MTVEYHTAHFVVGESDPQQQPQKALSDIVFMVKERLADALDNKEVGLAGTHPRVIISMVVTNILVNLLFHSIAVNDITKRMEMVQSSLDEISEMTMQLWKSLETNRADTKTAH